MSKSSDGVLKQESCCVNSKNPLSLGRGVGQDGKLVEEEKDEKPKKKKSKAKSKVIVYKVVNGKAITSKKGILSGGRIVTEDCFPGGKKTLDALVESGCVIAE